MKISVAVQGGYLSPLPIPLGKQKRPGSAQSTPTPVGQANPPPAAGAGPTGRRNNKKGRQPAAGGLTANKI